MHELVAQLLREPVESIDIDEDLLNRGLDSVRIMSLVEKWRREGKEITFADLAERPTVAGWYSLLSFTNSTGAVTNRLHNKGVVKNA